MVRARCPELLPPQPWTPTFGPCRRLIEAVIAAAREAGCYKVILDCSEANAPFYAKCGLHMKELHMVSAAQALCARVQLQCIADLLRLAGALLRGPQLQRRAGRAGRCA